MVYTYPSKKSLVSVMGKVRWLTRRRRHRTLADLLHSVNPVLRGWCNYFRHGVSSSTVNYLDHYAFWRVAGWLRKRHPKLNWGTVNRRYLPGWEVRDGKTEMFRPRKVAITRYRYRGTRIAHTMGESGGGNHPQGEPDAVKVARPVRRAVRGDGSAERLTLRPGPTPTPNCSVPPSGLTTAST
jgi:hypothetical protein